MTTFVTIPDSDVDPESPITTGLMVALRDNPIAITADLFLKEIEIGDWDMNATPSLNIPHGLNYADIHFVTATIRHDIDVNKYNIHTILTTGALGGGSIVTVSNILLNRVTGGFFDSTNFDTFPAYNRGWIAIWYVMQ